NLWIGSHGSSQVARYANGRFTMFTEADGLPKDEIRSLYSDRAGRLWMASGASGLVRVDDPGDAHPHFKAYGAGQGLASNFTTSIAEDRWGRIYVGTRSCRA